MIKKRFTIEKKQQFLYGKPLYFGAHVKFNLNFSQITRLTLDSYAKNNSDVAGTCAFGVIFNFVDDNNFCLLLISDKNYISFHVIVDKNLFCALKWQKLPKNRKNRQKIEFFFGENDFVIKCKNRSFTFSLGGHATSKLFCLAGQNYCIHEKVSCDYKICPCRPTKKTLFNKMSKKSTKIAEAKKVIDDFSYKNDNYVTDEANDEAWNFYDTARKQYICGNNEKALSSILAASASLSENLAVLELYGFILREKGEVERAVNLIQSCKKHSPYVKAYSAEADDLVARLSSKCKTQNENREANLKFNAENRAIFPIETPFVNAFLCR